METLPIPPASTIFKDIKVDFVSTTEGDDQRGFVPGYHFCILNSGGVNVGQVNFRVGDTDHIRLAAGHIGFEILKEHQGNHYASKACLALASWIGRFNKPILITADPDNLASIRTIQHIGGVFIDEVEVPNDDPHFLRGSLRKRRYQWDPNQAEQPVDSNPH